jgi:uncharacterized protein (TIGR03083 family)
MSAMEIDEHITALESDGRLLADAAGRAGLAAPVPSCPGWRVGDLLRHVRYIHRWAATHVREAPRKVIDGPPEAELLAAGPPDDELLDAYRAGHLALTETLRSADPALACATFLPAPSPLAFWARRQAHETAIHRADAELAATGTVTPFDPGFAADGIDELVTGFAPRERRVAHAGRPRTLRLRAADTGEVWQLAIGPDGVHGHRGTVEAATVEAGSVPAGSVPADTVVSGPASRLYLLLWNRQDADTAAVTITGDPDGLRLWRDTVRVRWA